MDYLGQIRRMSNNMLGMDSSIMKRKQSQPLLRTEEANFNFDKAALRSKKMLEKLGLRRKLNNSPQRRE